MKKRQRPESACHRTVDRRRVVAVTLSLLASIVFAWCAAAGPKAAGNVNSDTLLSALISVDNYTPFYWDQNSFGMLLPWLTQPIRDYGWNILTQMFLHTLCGIASIWLLNRWLFVFRPPVRNAWLFTIPLGFILYRHEIKAPDLLFQCQPYVPAMAMGVAGLVVLFRVSRMPFLLRAAGATLLFFVSVWINTSVVPLWLGLAVGELWANQPTKKPWKEVVITGAALIAVYKLVAVWASHFPPRLDKELIAWSLYTENLRKLLTNANETYVALWLLPVTIIVGVALWTKSPFAHAEKEPPIRRLAVIILVSGFYCLLVGASEWVHTNLSDSRYLTIPFFLVIFGSALLIVASLSPLISASSRTLAEALPPFATVVCVGLAFGYSTPSVAIARLAAQEDGAFREAQLAGCDVLAGNYSRVWMIIFRGKVRHSPATLMAFTVRSEHQSRQLNSFDPGTARWCAVCDDPQFAFELNRRHMTVPAGEGKVGSICWYQYPASLTH